MFQPIQKSTIPPGYSGSSNNCRVRRGFSLIELLVVVAIISLLAAFAIPAFTSIGQARGVAEAAYLVSAAVELARSEAIARRTFVWLGLQEKTHAGGQDLLVGLVGSVDGTTNNDAANLLPIGRPLRIQRVGLTKSSGVPGSPIELADFTAGLEFSFGQAASFTDGRSLTFTPLGEVMTNPAPAPGTPFDPVLAIGFATTRGRNLDANNISSVAIDGSTGIPTILRQ